MSIFDELKASLQEAVDIKQGQKPAFRRSRFEVSDLTFSPLVSGEALRAIW